MPIIDLYAYRKNIPPKGMWRMANGLLIKIKDMDLEHLVNTIAYLKRRFSGITDEFVARKAGIRLEVAELIMLKVRELEDELESRNQKDDSGDVPRRSIEV